MPRPRHKRKPKASTNAKTRGGTKVTASDVQATSVNADTYPLRCLTLQEDGVTQCGQLATEGHPKPVRCKVHHRQYHVLYKRYKDASKVVDDVKDSAELPTKEQIGGYTDWHAALEKSRWVGTYLESIRVERIGRDIHQTRFFLKGEDSHKRRLEVLEREMIRAVEVLDALQRRAYELYQHNGTLHAMNDQARSTAEVDLDKHSKQTTEEVLQSVHDPEAFRDSTLSIPRKKPLALPPTPAMGDDDLIDMSLRT
ncbi:hypothetical protein J3R82DRAFT_6371 [Butyriboletus roseoflavus]|nr:hypothetical protein J3R82DRAFT_6371 [Butyriboletus roseoflavus]